MFDRCIVRAVGVRFIVREPTVVQCGIDATRTGVIQVHNAPAVARVLREEPQVTTIDSLHLALLSTGISVEAAWLLIDEMRAFGIWQDMQPQPTIAVWGYSPLAIAIAAELKEDGFRVLSPVASRFTAPAESEKQLLPIYQPNVPIICVDLNDRTGVISAHLRAHAHTWVPVTSLDSHVAIGPTHREGNGPCLMCVNLYRADIDPQWCTVFPRQAHEFPLLDRPVLAAALAHVTILARDLTGAHQPPGAPSPQWDAGHSLDVDIFGGTKHTVIEPHPHCPQCFSNETFPGSDAIALPAS